MHRLCSIRPSALCYWNISSISMGNRCSVDFEYGDADVIIAWCRVNKKNTVSKPTWLKTIWWVIACYESIITRNEMIRATIFKGPWDQGSSAKLGVLCGREDAGVMFNWKSFLLFCSHCRLPVYHLRRFCDSIHRRSMEQACDSSRRNRIEPVGEENLMWRL